MNEREKIAQEWVDEYVALRDSLGTPVAWRSREKGSATWQVHGNDPTDAISKYAVTGLSGYDIEPLFTLGNCEECAADDGAGDPRTPEFGVGWP